MVPYAAGKAKWPHKQITRFKGSAIGELLRRAAVAYDEPEYEHLLSQRLGPEQLHGQRFQLTHPRRE